MKFWIRTYSIAVNVPDWESLKATLIEKFASNRGFTLATLNMDHLVKLETDQRFQRAYSEQDLVVADGNPIVWMSLLARRPVQLLPGSDLVYPLALLCAEQNVPIALIGSTEASLKKAANALKDSIPELKIVFRAAPTFGFNPTGNEADAILAAAQKSGARFCFLALGAPKQEIFAAHGRKVAPRIGFVAIGAGLDFLSGEQHRAPLWMRKLALEWLWRLLSNPGRMMERYVKSFIVLPGHLVRSITRKQD